LKNLTRVGHPTAATAPEPVDFYSPDTFNFTTLDVSADGKTLTVSSVGMEATAQNAALEYANGPQAQTLFSFQIDAVSNVADLATLSLSGVTTTPVFDAATASYTASVPGNTVAVTLTPTTAQAGATITVNGAALVSGSASVPVNVGSNTITVLVTAQDGGTTKSYTITVTRAAAPSYAFTAATSSVADSASSVALSITRTGDTTVASSVTVSTANGTALSSTDYTALSSQSVSFAANATTSTVSVPVLYRSGINGTRTFTATLANPSTGCLVGTPATTTVTITDADSAAAIAGPSSSASPYVLPIDSNWQTRSLLTVGDSIGGYQMAGIPDGLGAYDNNDGTITLLMNHELGSTVGVARAHGGLRLRVGHQQEHPRCRLRQGLDPQRLQLERRDPKLRRHHLDACLQPLLLGRPASPERLLQRRYRTRHHRSPVHGRRRRWRKWLGRRQRRQRTEQG
jgi:hypothetical protein